MLAAIYTIAPMFIAAPSTLIAATTVASKPKTVLPNRVTIYRLLDSLDVAELA